MEIITPLQKLKKKAGINPEQTFYAASKALKIKTAIQTVHFFAQCHYETIGFKQMSENLNYTKEGLLKVFPKYFTENNIASYVNNPEKIANKVYANRMGNGDESSGDGWRYRGRGAIQLTGKTNYQLFADYSNNQNIMDNPNIVSERYAFESAMFFFTNNNLWKICDGGVNYETTKKLTKAINGGYNGLAIRFTLTKFYESNLFK